MFKYLLASILIVFLIPACFKAPRDNEYDWQNPCKVHFEGKVLNAVSLPVARAVVDLEGEADTCDVDGHFIFEEWDPSIYHLQITGPNPFYDVIDIPACSLWAGREIDTIFFFRRAVWDMEDGDQMPKKWEPIIGSWRIMPDPMVPQNHVLGAIGRIPPFGYYGQAVCNEVFSDFIYEVMIKPRTLNPTGWQFGVVFNWQDPDNCHRFRLSATDVALHRSTTGGLNDSLIYFRHLPVRLGQWYKIRVEHIGTTIKVFLDGSEIEPGGFNDHYFVSGKVGLWFIAENRDSVTYHFDNIWVERAK